MDGSAPDTLPVPPLFQRPDQFLNRTFCSAPDMALAKQRLMQFRGKQRKRTTRIGIIPRGKNRNIGRRNAGAQQLIDAAREKLRTGLRVRNCRIDFRTAVTDVMNGGFFQRPVHALAHFRDLPRIAAVLPQLEQGETFKIVVQAVFKNLLVGVPETVKFRLFRVTEQPGESRSPQRIEVLRLVNINRVIAGGFGMLLQKRRQFIQPETFPALLRSRFRRDFHFGSQLFQQFRAESLKSRNLQIVQRIFNGKICGKHRAVTQKQDSAFLLRELLRLIHRRPAREHSLAGAGGPEHHDAAVSRETRKQADLLLRKLVQEM